MEWRPIDTAPKDGTAILAWFTGEYPEPVVVQYYVKSLDFPWGAISSLDGEYHRDYITHWMPLPPPPAIP